MNVVFYDYEFQKHYLNTISLLESSDDAFCKLPCMLHINIVFYKSFKN